MAILIFHRRSRQCCWPPSVSPAVAAACARASAAVNSQEELLGVALEAAIDEGDEVNLQRLMLIAHGELLFTCVEKGFASAVTIFLTAGVPGMQRLCSPSSDTPLHVTAGQTTTRRLCTS